MYNINVTLILRLSFIFMFYMWGNKYREVEVFFMLFFCYLEKISEFS